MCYLIAKNMDIIGCTQLKIDVGNITVRLIIE